MENNPDSTKIAKRSPLQVVMNFIRRGVLGTLSGNVDGNRVTEAVRDVQTKASHFTEGM